MRFQKIIWTCCAAVYSERQSCWTWRNYFRHENALLVQLDRDGNSKSVIKYCTNFPKAKPPGDKSFIWCSYLIKQKKLSVLDTTYNLNVKFCNQKRSILRNKISRLWSQVKIFKHLTFQSIGFYVHILLLTYQLNKSHFSST